MDLFRLSVPLLVTPQKKVISPDFGILTQLQWGQAGRGVEKVKRWGSECAS
jgi:hypothetical protein